MFGYVHPSKSRISNVDTELYKTAYCGLCESLRKKYGLIGRFTLNYDFTFLAMISAKNTSCTEKKCIRHPFKTHTCICNSEIFDHIADLSIILSYWQIVDAINDHNSLKKLKYVLIKLLLTRKYKAAKSIMSDFDHSTKEQLDKLSVLESQKCASIDNVADCFATLLSRICVIYNDANEQRIMAQLLYHLGRWIYIVDAVDDYEKDIKTGNYNPIIYRYNFKESKLNDTLKENIKRTLDASVRNIAASYELMTPNEFHSLIENIVYEGLYAVENTVFTGNYHKAIRKAEEHGE